MVDSIWPPPDLQTKIFTPKQFVPREITTYNWLWLKIGFCKNSPTFDNDCPWLFLMVMVYDTISENCLHWNLKGNLGSNGVSDNLGIQNFSPAFWPVMTIASNMWFPSRIMTNLVSLHNPFDATLPRMWMRMLFAWRFWWNKQEEWHSRPRLPLHS